MYLDVDLQPSQKHGKAMAIMPTDLMKTYMSCLLTSCNIHEKARECMKKNNAQEPIDPIEYHGKAMARMANSIHQPHTNPMHYN